MKELVKIFLFYTGLTALYHKIRNRDTLTVLMLHRVLPDKLQHEFGANPEWTMSPDVFRDLLKFINRYYNPVSASQVETSKSEGKKLPDNALLITFDDGWQDNYQFAAHILNEEKVPAIIFIVTETINQQLPFWQELIYSCCSRSSDHLKECINLSGATDCGSPLSLISYLSKLKSGDPKRCDVINYCTKKSEDLPRQLISENEIKELINLGIELGTHGATHQQLGLLESSEQLLEITISKEKLEGIAGHQITAISFPHGSSNHLTIPACLKNGYSMMFNSNAKLNKSLSNPLARIHVSETSIALNGAFSAMKACYRLFFLPHN